MAELRLERPLGGAAGLLVFGAAAAAAPWFMEGSSLQLAVEVCVMIAMAQAWNLLAGYTGFVSVGQQAFIGLGAYALFAVAVHGGINPFLAVPLGGLVAAGIGVVAAPALFRLRGPHFAIGTWVLAELFRIAFTHSAWFGRGIDANGTFPECRNANVTLSHPSPGSSSSPCSSMVPFTSALA